MPTAEGTNTRMENVVNALIPRIRGAAAERRGRAVDL